MPANKAVGEFRRKHPADFQKYAYLNPVNLDTYRELLGFEQGLHSGQIAGLRKRFESVPGVNDLSERQLRADATDRQVWITGFQDLESASSGGGVICQFEWSDGKTSETGLLAIKNGEVVKRDVWLVDYLSEQGATSGQPNPRRGGNGKQPSGLGGNPAPPAAAAGG